jgi:hypothetical protein
MGLQLANKAVYLAIIIGGIAVAAAVSVAAISNMNNPSPSTNQSNDELTSNPELFPIDSRPYGKSHEEWTGAVWQWFQEIPAEVNPANDATGEFCDMNQNDPDAWFLAGTFGGKQERECAVPADRALVILVAGVSCSYAEDPTLKTEDDLRRCAEENAGEMNVRASVDGVRIQGVENYFWVSPLFPVKLPEGNVWDVPGPVETESVAAGWTLIVKPLPEGEHVIQFSAEERQFAATSEPPFSIEAIYHLTVTNSDA